MIRQCPLCAALAIGLLPAPLAAQTADADPPARPQPILSTNRWQEDWSMLARDGVRHEPFDALKYIDLGDGNALSFGFNQRVRYESNDAPAFGSTGAGPQRYVITRSELHADLRLGQLQGFVQVQADFAPGKAGLGPADADRLGLEQGFLAWVAPLGPVMLKLRLGRQQFAFDTQRFVSVRNGANVRQSFDAVWADVETGRWRVIGYATHPVINRNTHAFADFSSSQQTFSGIRIERKVLGDNELSAYWSRYTHAEARYSGVLARERRDVWDLRFAGHRGTLDWDLEAMAQTGQFGARRIRAWGGGAILGNTIRTLPAQPRIALQADIASGATGGAQGPLGTFNPLFPSGTYVTLSGYTGYANFVHVKPSLTLHPAPRLAVLGALGLQWRETTADAVYLQPAVPVAGTAGRPGRTTGTYLQSRTDWIINGHCAAALEAVHFDPAGALRAAHARASDYLGLELRLAW